VMATPCTSATTSERFEASSSWAHPEVMKPPHKKNEMARGRTFLNNFIFPSYVDKVSKCQFLALSF